MIRNCPSFVPISDLDEVAVTASGVPRSASAVIPVGDIESAANPSAQLNL